MGVTKYKVGDTLHRWKVVKYLGNSLWNVQCIDCKVVKKMAPKAAKRGRKCSNCRSINAKTQWIGYVTKSGSKVVKFLHIRKNDKKHIFRCKCACGASFTACSTILRRVKSGNIKDLSCGCHYRGVNAYNFSGYAGLYGKYMQRIKRNAASRKIVVKVDAKYLFNLMVGQKYKCKLSGVPIEFAEVGSENQTASLDRINSKKGYVKGNVQWVHKDINTMKWDLTQDEFIKLCKLVVKHN